MRYLPITPQFYSHALWALGIRGGGTVLVLGVCMAGEGHGVEEAACMQTWGGRWREVGLTLGSGGCHC